MSVVSARYISQTSKSWTSEFNYIARSFYIKYLTEISECNNVEHGMVVTM